MTKLFTAVANYVSMATGRPIAFVVCCLLILVWAATGPIFHFSDTWQLVVNTGTTIVTFLMVFLIQNTQNRDNLALQIKLDELIRVSHAPNKFIGVEHLTDKELYALMAECETRVTELKKKKGGGAAKAAESTKAAAAREAAKRRAAKSQAKTTVKRG